jgi:hypothetical protein
MCENSIESTPMGSSMSIRTGEAFDVKIKSVVEERKRINSEHRQTTMRYELSNARDQPVADLVQSGLWGDFAQCGNGFIECLSQRV